MKLREACGQSRCLPVHLHAATVCLFSVYCLFLIYNLNICHLLESIFLDTCGINHEHKNPFSQYMVNTGSGIFRYVANFMIREIFLSRMFPDIRAIKFPGIGRIANVFS